MPNIVSVSRVAEVMSTADRDDKGRCNNLFLVGAGVSISAGIPGALGVAKRAVKELCRDFQLPHGQHFENYNALLENGRFAGSVGMTKAGSDLDVDWYAVYDECFSKLLVGNRQKSIFSRIIDEAAGAINWGHLALGQIVSSGFGMTVLTTNFDQLALDGMVRAGVLPVVCDSIESFNKIRGKPEHPQLIHAHGTRHTYRVRNSTADVAALIKDSDVIRAVSDLVAQAGAIVVVGYGGREEGLMDLLITAASRAPEIPIFWVLHENTPSALPPKAEALLRTTNNGGIILGQDSDAFFLELSKLLKVGAPAALANPLRSLDRLLADLKKSNVVDRDMALAVQLTDSRLEELKQYLDDLRSTGLGADTLEMLLARLAGDDLGAYNASLAISPTHLPGAP